VVDYNLHATLDSGQAFRWSRQGDAWTGILGRRWVRLRSTAHHIEATTTRAPEDWRWLTKYLQSEVDLRVVIAQFPDHPFLARAIRAHYGLRLLRQDPWECLASFILSSTKQIAQIKQVVARLCERCGNEVDTPPGEPRAWSFPSATQVAALSQADLRRMGMGFRAPYLLEAARRVSRGDCALTQLSALPLESARDALMELPGVGRKIADCVLLFALGFDEAFPVDVWMMRTLQDRWFPGRRRTLRELVAFADSQFGPQGGYVQQYLFHFSRTLEPELEETRP
jgi:N-glycosylase/DNA lyase